MYKRVLLKLSGEALSSPEAAFDPEILKRLAKELKEVQKLGVELAIVVGGGNFIRGKMMAEMGMNRAQADYMGMLGTVINALAVQNALEQEGVQTRVQTAVEMQKVAEPFILRRALRHLEKGRIVIFGAGTGSPYFSTDTTAALRASEINADVILMAKNGVDGVYDSDPKKNPNAKKYDTLNYMDVLNEGLQVMDSTAISMCMDNDIDLVVFNMNEPGNIVKAVRREVNGTTITKEIRRIKMSDILLNAEEKMMGVIDNLESNLRQIRTGRASGQMLERVQVEYYGAMTPINQMAQISVVEGTQLVIKPYDRSIIKDIAHAIQAANLGLNPQAEADVIRIQVPQLTEDRRKELAKDAQKYGEEAKIAIRNVRRDANDAIKKDKELPEDEQKQTLEESQKLTDKYIKDVDSICEAKKKEILNV